MWIFVAYILRSGASNSSKRVKKAGGEGVGLKAHTHMPIHAHPPLMLAIYPCVKE